MKIFMTILKMILLIPSLILFISCENTVEKDVEPQLEIIVKDSYDNFVSEADVKLFITENDWKSKTNSIIKTETDFEGKVLFQNLEERVYYILVEKEDKNNVLTISYFDTPLKINEKRILTISIN